MLFPLRLLLDTVRPWLSPSLVSDPVRERIHALAARLPAAWSVGLFECRLKPGEDRVDFMVGACPQEEGRERLAALFAEDDGGAALGSARRVLHDWLRDGSELQEDVPAMWLEYDLPAQEEREPLFSLCVEPNFKGTGCYPPLSPVRLVALCAHALRVARASEPDPGLLRTLGHCVEQLPPNGRMLHLATQYQRGRPALRALINLHLQGLRTWLQKVGWTGSWRGLDSVLELLEPDRKVVAFQAEIGDGVGPYFAVELDFVDGGAEQGSCRRLLDRLVRLGVCDPAKGRAVPDWMGDTKVKLPGDGWLVNIQRRFYLKLVAGESGLSEVKAYLGFHPTFTLF